MLRIITIAVALFAAAWATASSTLAAQAFPGDFIIAGSWYLNGDAVARVSRKTNTVTTLVRSISSLQAAFHVDVVQAEDNSDFYLLSEAERSVYRFDRQGGSLQTIFNGYATFTGPRDMFLDDRGDIIIADSAGIFRLNPITRQLTTMAAPTAFGTIHAVTQNIDDGRLLVGGTGGLVQFDQLTGTTTSLIGLPGGAGFRFEIGQEHAAGRLYAGTCCGTANGQVMLRFDLQAAQSTVLVGSHPVARAAYAHHFDRRVNAVGQHMLYASVNGFAIPGNVSGMFALDEAGTVTSMVSYGSPVPGVLTSWGMEIEGSRNLAVERLAGVNDRRIHLSFPGQGGRSCAVALSLSGVRPGIPIGDGRQINLVPDNATFLSVSGALPGVWDPGTGILDAGGRGRVELRLTRFGPALRGIPVWVSAVAIDPAAPGGIGAIAETIVILLE